MNLDRDSRCSCQAPASRRIAAYRCRRPCSISFATSVGVIFLLLGSNAHVCSSTNEGGIRRQACSSFKTCAACTSARYDASAKHWWDRRPTCSWCPLSFSCLDHHRDEHACWDERTNQTAFLRFEYDCPLGPTPYPDDPIAFLPDWMGAFRQAGLWENVTLSELCLPGTHDSLTYDLSLTVSESGMDGIRELADLLHRLSAGRIKLLPGELEDFFRMQAKTQQLTLTQQMDNGIRFFDFRMMLEPDRDAWYSIHFMQSNHVVGTYWKQIRDWMDAHPNEIVVLWLSRDGNAGAKAEDQYPGVSLEQKERIWKTFTTIFDGLLFDAREASIFTDTIETLLAKNFRMIAFATDYVEFTGSSPFALDAAVIQNRWDAGRGVFDEERTLEAHRHYFRNALSNNAAVHARSGFTVLAMNTAGEEWQVVASAKKRFLGWGGGLFDSCCSNMNMPDPPNWCPETLLDVAQLSSYYNQVALEYAIENLSQGDYTGFPNALYLDALDVGGTVRTGAQLLDGADRGGNAAMKQARYAYVDTVLAYNVGQACKDDQNRSCCTNMTRRIEERRQRLPKMLWEDHSRGRHSQWPGSSRLTQYNDTFSNYLFNKEL